MEPRTMIPQSNLALEDWGRIIDKAPVVALDFETEGLNVYDGTDRPLGFAVGVRVADGYISDYIPFGHHDGENVATEKAIWLLRKVLSRVVVFHNAVFDLSVLFHMGLPHPAVFFDTMDLDHKIDENCMVYSLDATTERWLGFKGKEKSERFKLALMVYGWKNMPSHEMYDYAKADGDITIRSLDKMVKSKEFTPALVQYWKDIEQPTILLLSKMRRAGVGVNLDVCRSEQVRGEARMAELEEELGGKPSSRKFLEELLNNKLGIPILLNKDGKQSYDKDTMKRYEARLKFIAENETKLYGESTVGTLASRVLEYRGWQKAVSGYYIPYQRFVEKDGRLRASYNVAGTRTGRFSCSEPNLQQIPKETDKDWSKGVKGALVAKSGYTLWELDYSQLEFRLTASAAKESSLLDIFSDPGRDIFTEMALQLGMVRQDTKTMVYSILYGAGVSRIMDAFGVSEERAREILDTFYSHYPNLRAAGRHYGKLAKTRGYIDLWSGRRRHFRNPESEYYKAFNSYIQGGAADLVKRAMIEIDREVCNDECALLLQVHDSVVLEIEDGKEDIYLPQAKDIMVRYSDFFGVRLDADAHRWAKQEGVLVGSGV